MGERLLGIVHLPDNGEILGCGTNERADGYERAVVIVYDAYMNHMVAAFSIQRVSRETSVPKDAAPPCHDISDGMRIGNHAQDFLDASTLRCRVRNVWWWLIIK